MTNSTSAVIGTKSAMLANRIISVLSLLLVAQIALAILLKLSEAGYQPIEPTAPLLTCNFNKIAKVVIEEMKNDGKKSKVVLQKIQPGWILPEYYSAPASGGSVDRLLNTLKDLKKGFPVTTTASAAERFKVSTDNFARAVFLYDDHQNVAALYLGSSPSFRTVYAKVPNSNYVYAVELSPYQVSGEPDTWVDKNIAGLKPTQIACIDMGGFKVQKIDNNWTLSTQGKVQVLPKNVAQNLVDMVAHIGINSILGTQSLDYGVNNPELSYRVTLKDGAVVDYAFFKPKDKNFYVLKISNKGWYFAVNDWLVSRLKSLTPEYLLQGKTGEASKQQAQQKH